MGVNVVANGEIWTVDEALRCREVSGCDDLMLGRGIVADPGLALAVRAAVEQGVCSQGAGIDWLQLVPQVQRFWEMVCEDLEPRQRAGRLKQWLNLMRRRFPEAEVAYQEVRTQTDQRAISDWVAALPKRVLQHDWLWPVCDAVVTADCLAP